MTATAEQIVHLTREVPGVGLIEFIQTPSKREYWLTPEGAKRRRRMPSVTTILRATWPKPQLLEWYAKHGQATRTLMDEAAARGSDVHRFIEHYMQTGELLALDEFPEHHRPYLQGAARFLFEHDPQPMAIELLVCHPDADYAGRLDLIAELDGRPTLLDFKTNPKGRVYAEAHVQAAAYRIAHKRCGGEEIDSVALVGIAEDGTYNLVDSDWNVAAKVWGSVQDFHRQMQRLERTLA